VRNLLLYIGNKKPYPKEGIEGFRIYPIFYEYGKTLKTLFRVGF